VLRSRSGTAHTDGNPAATLSRANSGHGEDWSSRGWAIDRAAGVAVEARALWFRTWKQLQQLDLFARRRHHVERSRHCRLRYPGCGRAEQLHSPSGEDRQHLDDVEIIDECIDDLDEGRRGQCFALRGELAAVVGHGSTSFVRWSRVVAEKESPSDDVARHREDRGVVGERVSADPQQCLGSRDLQLRGGPCPTPGALRREPRPRLRYRSTTHPTKSECDIVEIVSASTTDSVTHASCWSALSGPGSRWYTVSTPSFAASCTNGLGEDGADPMRTASSANGAIEPVHLCRDAAPGPACPDLNASWHGPSPSVNCISSSSLAPRPVTHNGPPGCRPSA
jgi:hypothetical protein